MIESSILQPSVQVFPDGETLSMAAAQLFAEAAQTAVAERGLFTVALSGGGTPRAMYRLLAQPPYDTTLPWTATHLFWGDERLVPPNDEGSSYGQASADLLSHLPISPRHIHRARGEFEAEAAVADYTEQLRHFANAQPSASAWPRFDLFLLGLGSDGHTASLFPGAASDDWQRKPVVPATADYAGRPAQRLSLTPLVINDARHILFLVTGADKAVAVAATLQGPTDLDRWPAQHIHPRAGKITWMLDQAAASQQMPTDAC